MIFLSDAHNTLVLALFVFGKEHQSILLFVFQRCWLQEAHEFKMMWKLQDLLSQLRVCEMCYHELLAWVPLR